MINFRKRKGCVQFTNEKNQRKRNTEYIQLEWWKSSRSGKFYVFYVWDNLNRTQGWHFMNQTAANRGCTIIQSCHLKFKRLLGDSKCILTDEKQCEWLLLVDYNTNQVLFHKATDSNKSDAEVLLFLKPLEQGMYWRYFKDIIYNK